MWLWCAVAALAAQLQLRAEPTELRTGQTGTVRLLIVSSGRNESVSPSRPPPLVTGRGLVAAFAGQSRQFQNVNGRITLIHEFDYRVSAVKAGLWSVGPVIFTMPDGTVASVDAVQITVRDPEPGAPSPDFEAAAFFEPMVIGGQTPKPPVAYEGQTVLFRTRFSSKLPGAQVSWRIPTFDGLRSPQHGLPDESSYALQDPAGTITVKETVTPLVAVATGHRDQGAALAVVSLPVGDGAMFGFRRRQEQAASERLVLEIKALPPPPPDFSGLVGEFTVTSTVDVGKRKGNKVSVGQSIPWNIVITGDGVVEGYSLPRYEAKGTSVYDDDTTISGRIHNEKFRTTAAFRRVIVPTDRGTLALPSLEIVTFSPATGKYVSHNVELAKLEVVAGREGDAAVEVYGVTDGPAEALPAVALRAPFTWGSANAPSLLPVLPPMLLLAGAPGLLVLSLAGARSFSARSRVRRLAKQGPPTASEALLSLPKEPEARRAAYDMVLRRLASETAGEASFEAQISSFRQALGAVRFGGKALPPNFEDELFDLVDRAAIGKGA